ncbi:hypothetical protein [Methylobacterium sp. JK268]
MTGPEVGRSPGGARAHPSRRRILAGGWAGLALALAPRRARAFPAPPPWPLGDFLDSVGLNVHLDDPSYATRFEEVRTLVAGCGIRHLRDELRPSNDLGRWRELFARHGIRAHLLVSPVTNTPAEMLAYLDAVGVPTVSAIEGQNEGDSDWFMAHPAARGDWSRTVVAYQREVHAALRARYDPATLPLLSPSLLDYRPQDVALIRDAAAFCDAVAIHSYTQGGQEPETEDGYAGIGWYLANFRTPFKPDAPAICTETGYCTPPVTGRSGVSEAAAAVYLPRLLLHNFASGIPRTFLYQLLDGGDDPGNSEHHWGLVRHDGSLKPAYRALRGLMGALATPDDGPAAAADRTVLLPEATPDLRSVVLARRDGGTVVALWRALRCWDPARGIDLPMGSAPQRVVLGRPAARARVIRPAEQEGWSPLDLRDDAVTLPVGGTVTLVAFAPA